MTSKRWKSAMRTHSRSLKPKLSTYFTFQESSVKVRKFWSRSRTTTLRLSVTKSPLHWTQFCAWTWSFMWMMERKLCEALHAQWTKSMGIHDDQRVITEIVLREFFLEKFKKWRLLIRF